MPSVLLEDNVQMTADTKIPWDEMKNASVLITGATGLIGGALVRMLAAASEQLALNLSIFAHGRNAEKGKRLSQSCGVQFISGDIRKSLPVSRFTGSVDFIFHCASITKSADMVSKPNEVMDTAADGTRNVFELAKEKQSKSVVYLSSMEVYGQTALPEVTEADLGQLDLSNPRSSYPASKRFCESLCLSYFTQYAVPVKIARLAQTFGAGTPPDDTRVFAQFARSAMNGENIILHTEGKSQGNYCYISDAVRGLLYLLLKGKNGETYNIANPNAAATVREMAELVAEKLCGGEISVTVSVPSDIAERGYAPDAVAKLNVDKIKGLGWIPQYGLAEMYRRMIAGWQEACDCVQ